MMTFDEMVSKLGVPDGHTGINPQKVMVNKYGTELGIDAVANGVVAYVAVEEGASISTNVMPSEKAAIDQLRILLGGIEDFFMIAPEGVCVCATTNNL